MSEKIFFIDASGELVPLIKSPFKNEDLFQRLIADFPEFLLGDQMGSEPLEFMLIMREAGIADSEDRGTRWSVDHLFVDQYGIPTLVEVKRKDDTRLRREVVGQMLDYASHAVFTWNIETLRAYFEATCQQNHLDPDEVLLEKLQQEDADQFWETVAQNLKIGKIRLLFVADEIPEELRRIVEFLNRQMNPAEVLAVEIQHYQNGEQRVTVPRVFGAVAETRSKSTYTKGEKWNEERFFPEIVRHNGAITGKIAKKILDWAKAHNLPIRWGAGKTTGSFSPQLNINGTQINLVSIWTYGTIEMQFEYWLNKPIVGNDAIRLKLIDELNTLDGMTIPRQDVSIRPSFQIQLLEDPAKLAQFLEVMEWFIDEITSYNGEG